MQGASIIAACDFRFGRLCRFDGDFRRLRNEGVELRLQRLGSSQQGPRVLDRRQLGMLDQMRGLGKCQIVESRC